MMIFELIASAQKGVVYLPVVSLSDYLPVVAQIMLMILVISLSGVFGAWLMFQRLAKKVLALETTATAQVVAAVQETPAAPVTVAVAAAEEAAPCPVEAKPVRISGARARKKEKARIRAAAQTSAAKTRNVLLPTVSGNQAAPKHKRTLFVTKPRQSSLSRVDIPSVSAEIAVPQNQTALAAGSRLVLSRQSRRPVAKVAAGATADEARMAPQTFLVNDWFPMDN